MKRLNIHQASRYINIEKSEILNSDRRLMIMSSAVDGLSSAAQHVQGSCVHCGPQHYSILGHERKCFLDVSW